MLNWFLPTHQKIQQHHLLLFTFPIPPLLTTELFVGSSSHCQVHYPEELLKITERLPEPTTCIRPIGMLEEKDIMMTKQPRIKLKMQEAMMEMVSKSISKVKPKGSMSYEQH